MISRRDFLKLSTASLAAIYASTNARFLLRGYAAQSPQVPLAAKNIPKFVDPLPDLDVIVDNGGEIELQMNEFQTQVLPAAFPATWVWGYLQPGQGSRASYLGPVVVAARNQPTRMKFVNNLGHSATTNLLAYKYGTDQTLHWADPLNNEMNMIAHMAMPPAFGDPGSLNYDGPIPTVPHLHGGEVPPVLDGGPNAWYTSDGAYHGSTYYSLPGTGGPGANYNVYRYPNGQESAPVWFHDHTLGATRLNVYCGMAGAYLLTDPVNDPPNLPPLIPIVPQDRMFDTNGQLFFPADSAGGILWALNPEHPYWVPEFIGDAICVNGKTWPFKTVEARRYTLLFINGSNARTYELFLVDPVSKNPGPALWVIGNDGGYLDAPTKLDPAAAANTKLAIMPGERYTAIVDFAGFQAGVLGPNGLPYSGTWLLKNTAKAPYPAGAAPQGATTAQIMQFRVTGEPVIDTSFNPAVVGASLRGGAGQGPAIIRLVNPTTGTVVPGLPIDKTRQLTLNEVMGMPQTAIDPVTNAVVNYPGGPLEILVNNTKWDGKRIVGVMTDPMTGMQSYNMAPIPGFTLDGLGMNYLSETPHEGDTEIWEIINLTADAHPIHTHLVTFQLLNRQNFDVNKYTAAYAAAFPGGGYDPMTSQPYPASVFIPGWGPPLDYATGNPAALGGNPNINALNARGQPLYLQGKPMPPLPQEAGWKDTVRVMPGQVTRFVIRWAPNSTPAGQRGTFPFDPNALGQGYVWHCHIIDHEDNEMMRPDQIVPDPNAVRTYIQGVDY